MASPLPDTARLRASLERTPQAVRALLDAISDDDARWRPAPDQWSIVEIVNHIADEDADDFLPRIELTLRDPSLPWPPIDPPAAARDRRYNERELAPSVDRLDAVRRSSLNAFDALISPDWARAHNHPSIGPLRAGDLLASWVAHDHLHIRQLAKRLYALANRDSGDYSTRYAGEWGP